MGQGWFSRLIKPGRQGLTADPDVTAMPMIPISWASRTIETIYPRPAARRTTNRLAVANGRLMADLGMNTRSCLDHRSSATTSDPNPSAPPFASPESCTHVLYWRRFLKPPPSHRVNFSDSFRISDVNLAADDRIKAETCHLKSDL